MKNDLKKPCVECPFKKDSAPGWLGGETAEDTFDHVVGEGDFACHMTRHKKASEMSRCRGSLLFLRKMAKSPKFNKDLEIAVRSIPFEEAYKNEEILSRMDFLKHHKQD